ncbi:unnamed protein product [Allacma fusca]|uniref:Uncharacterized protein n=1 Tax=Allacma fusca TaxID=39272 RepID=A0A8J2LN87_9HEXA|nr:unnamed protein product [Allacma fusca]
MPCFADHLAVKDTVELKLKYLNNFLEGRQYAAGNQMSFLFLTHVRRFLPLRNFVPVWSVRRNWEKRCFETPPKYQQLRLFNRIVPKLKGFIQSTSKNVVYSPRATILY